MTFDDIRLFVLISKYHSVTQAAHECHITQSAASHRLKGLQRCVGIKLIRQTGRGVELTSAGEAFFCEVLPLAVQFQALKKKYSPNRNFIEIAASNRPSKYVLPPLISEFHKTHPQATVNLTTRSSVQIEKLMLDGKLDLAITTDPRISTSSFATESYCREPLTAFVSSNHPLTRVKSLQPSAIGIIPVILKPRGDGESQVEGILRNLSKQGFQFRIVARCESPEVVKEFVRYGTGVGFLFYNSIKRGIESGYFKTIQFPGLSVVGENRIVYPKDKPLSPMAREFLEFLRAALRKVASIETASTPQSNGNSNGRAGDYVRQSKLRAWILTIASFEWMASVIA
ncbi:MAG TPA: LysR family transcriptional regulator [Candidatus Binatia bacterium]|nr:LysR family transcriptional regulator [Candidatus Binatia bacterium]